MNRLLAIRFSEPRNRQMRKELEQKMFERWPQWFNPKGDVRHTRMSLGFQHEDGWFDILWRLSGDLEPLAAEFEQTTGRHLEVLQVKEKFGGLRIHMNLTTDAIRQRLLAAQLESFLTCEVCGHPGQRRECGWIKTLCDLHTGARDREPKELE
jgi:hypothetical protein